MSEKLQEWIEAVERAAVIVADKACGCARCRDSDDLVYTDDATRLTELAAYLRDGAMPTGASILAAERATRQIGGMMAALAVGYFAMCCYARPLPAPPAALATPGGEE